LIIKDLHVYGYGKLENQRFPELGQLQIFFGENESGKSTIMSFIHSMLFGFPTKVQNEPRYEPKMHAKYGGRLSLITKKTWLGPQGILLSRNTSKDTIYLFKSDSLFIHNDDC